MKRVDSLRGFTAHNCLKDPVVQTQTSFLSKQHPKDRDYIGTGMWPSHLMRDDMESILGELWKWP